MLPVLSSLLRRRGAWAGLATVLVVGAGLAACGSTEMSEFPLDDTDGGFDLSHTEDGATTFKDDASGFSVTNVDSVFFDPPTATITVDGITPQSANYTLKAKLLDGTTTSVAPQAIQFDRPDLAKYTGSTPIVLTSNGPYAGKGILHGVYGGKSATAELHVIVHAKEIGPGVAGNAITALDAANLPADPSVTSLLYPYDKTVFPLGLASPLLMWTAPKANDVYKIHFEELNYSYDAYYVVGATGQLRAAQAGWDHLTASNTGDVVKVSLSRWDSTANKAYASAKEDWTIAPASLRGAIYYWTTSAGGHMSRIRPGTGTAPEVLNGGKCMGCHAVSADGSTLVASVENGTVVTEPGGAKKNDPGLQRNWISFDLPAATTRYSSNRFSGNVALTPEGKYVVFGSQTLRLAETASPGTEITGTGLDTVALDTGMDGLMTPAFSPNGKKLVAVEGKGSWYHNLTGGKIVTLDFDATTKKFTNLTSLAPASMFPVAQRGISYPSFTPDSQYIAFHVGDYPTGCDAQGCDDAAKQIGSLWLQNTNGAAPINLATLNDSSPKAADDNLSLEPTFNPVERGGYSWVVFTSMRDWGNKLTGVANNGKKRLWVAAIDKTVGTVDPSHPAFFLEGQEEATTNMRGFWALAACTPTKGGGACTGGFECCSGFCDQGVCVDPSALACKGIKDTCTVKEDCCNPSVVDCIQGKCDVKVK
ncbi:MAG: hypothetical protein JWM74_636 [Myxococcaceae bacterium]|nr:hypothetical protein [Myxococcaceae bacterium]